MNLKFQQAIAAAQTGKTKEAQYLLTQLLSEEPDNANGWFLLSTLVESDDKQKAYLQKAVELDPTNDIAQEQLALLEEGAPVAEMEEELTAVDASWDEAAEPMDLEAVMDAEISEPMEELGDADEFDWLAEAVAADSISSEEEFAPEDEFEPVDERSPQELDDLYGLELDGMEEPEEDELPEIPEEMDTLEETAVDKSEKPEAAPQEKPKPAPAKKDRQKEIDNLNRIIYGLGAVAIVIALILIYYLFLA